MKKLVVLICVLATFGCHTLGGTPPNGLTDTQRLEPKEVHAKLKGAPFKNVSYPQTGYEVYDRFFKKVAEFEARFEVAKRFLEDFESLVESGFIADLKSGDVFETLVEGALSEEIKTKVVLAFVTGDVDHIEGVPEDALASARKKWVEKYPKLKKLATYYYIARGAFEVETVRLGVEKLVGAGRKLSDRIEKDFKNRPKVAVAVSEAVVRMIYRLQDISRQAKEVAKAYNDLKKDIKENF